MSAMAKASPTTSAAVVLHVGAILSGHASSSIGVCRIKSECLAIAEFGWAVIEMTLAPTFLATGRIASTSSLSPDFPTASTISSFLMIPTPPCSPSALCRNNAGVPVDTIVAAIFCAMMPDFPTPVTTTFP